MKVCIIGLDYHERGVLGGYGRITRRLAQQLIRHGLEVSVVAPRLRSQPKQVMDGAVEVLTFAPRQLLRAKQLLRLADADVYHSQEPSLATRLAQAAMPDRQHVVTFHAPCLEDEWSSSLPAHRHGWLRRSTSMLHRHNPLVTAAVRHSNAVFTAARQLAGPIMVRFGLREEPGFLPSPVEIPETVVKSVEPSVLWMGPLDSPHVKSVILPLAVGFPEVHFIVLEKPGAAGGAASLLEAPLPANVTFESAAGTIGDRMYENLIASSWILVNTDGRGGIPNGLLDAATHGTAVLSDRDPDDFASNFGFHVRGGDFNEGLAWLLGDGRWQARAELGRQYVERTFEAGRAGGRHLDIYAALLG